MSHVTSPALLLPVLHLGSLHAYEKALVLLIAFGPFVALAVVVHVVRRRDVAEADAGTRSDGPQAASTKQPSTESQPDS